MAVSFAAGLLIQRIILRPFEKAPVLTNVNVFIGLLLIFNAFSGWFFDHTVKAFPSPFPQESMLKTAYFSAHELGTFLVMMIVLAALYSFFRFTPIGLAMRGQRRTPTRRAWLASACRGCSRQDGGWPRPSAPSPA